MSSRISAQQSSCKQWVGGFAAASILFHHSVDIPWFFGPLDEAVTTLEFARNLGLVIIGAIIGAVLADIFGRKRTLLAALIFVIPRFISIIIENEKLAWIVEIFVELGSGITCTVVPLYICEIASANNRGKLMVLQLLVHVIGLFTEAAIVIMYQYISDMSETVALSLHGVFLAISVLFHGITLAIFPETPHYLNSKKRYQEAAASLSFFGGMNHVKIREETVELTPNAQPTNRRSGCLGKISEIWQFENRRSLAMIFSLIVIRWVSGQYKNSSIMHDWAYGMSEEHGSMSALLGTFGAMIIFAVFTILTIGLLQRKIPLVLVIFGCFIAAMLAIAIFMFYPRLTGIAMFIQNLGHLILVGCTLAYTGEFFSVNVRALGIAVVMCFEILIRNIILSSSHLISISGQVFYCGAVFFVGFIFVLVFFPKTKKLASFEIPIETFAGGQLS